ncbi:hypothetical protein [Nonomuraea sp. NPDC002799]
MITISNIPRQGNHCSSSTSGIGRRQSRRRGIATGLTTLALLAVAVAPAPAAATASAHPAARSFAMAPSNGSVGFIYVGTEIGQTKLTFQYDGSDNEIYYSSYLAYTSQRDGKIASQRYLFSDLKKESDGFSCLLKMTDGYYEGYWLDSKDGYLQAVSSKANAGRWRFIDKGAYYHWLQVDTNRHVRVVPEWISGGGSRYVRALHGEPPADEYKAQFNIKLN